MFCCFPFLCQYFFYCWLPQASIERNLVLMWMRKPQAQSTQRWVIKGCINFGWPSLPWRGKERNVHGLARGLQKCAAALARLKPSSIMYTVSRLQFLTWGETDQWGRLNATAGSPYVVLSERLPAFLLHSEESGQCVFITVRDILAWGSLHKKRSQNRNPNREGGWVS